MPCKDNNPPELQKCSSTDSSTQRKSNELELHCSTSEETNGANSDDNSESQKINIFQRFVKYLYSHDGKELLMVVLVTAVIVGFSYTMGDPLERPIPFQYLETTGTYILNQNLNHHSDGDSISDLFVAMLACVFCPVLQFLLTFITKNRWADAHRTVCVYLLTLAVNDCLTWTLKSYMGIQRPNFYQACEPNETYEYCNNTEGKKGEFEFGGSFPSGHASYTFCSLTLLYLYLERSFGVTSIQQLVVERQSTNNKPIVGLEYTCNAPLFYRLMSILFAIPLVVGTFMSASRIVDNQHHPSDIVAGTLMGVFIGYYFHSIWFPDPRFATLEKPSYAK